jgi:hypothetical protein
LSLQPQLSRPLPPDRLRGAVCIAPRRHGPAAALTLNPDYRYTD